MSRGWRDWTALGAAIVPLGVVALAMSGCGSKPDFPPNLAFPSRTDVLVLKSPEKKPSEFGQAAKIDEELLLLDEIGGKTANPSSASAEKRAAIDHFLKETFGTPAASKVILDADANSVAERLALTPDALTEGGKLFRERCLNCHNLSGDGRGPGGLWVMPYPRDFRRGMFKFTSTGSAGKPRRADILRTLSEGLKGTAMPSFGLLSERERELLAGYVTFLSLRGQVEFETLAAVLAGTSADVPALVSVRAKALLAEWERAEAAPAIPSPPDDGDFHSPGHQAAVQRGYELFTRKADNACITCHAEFGRKPVLQYDVWGTVSKPADLTTKSLKGGVRPEDIFARIRGGIPAVGMPAHPELADRQVWDLVRFVKSVPSLRELPPDIRKVIYPDSGGAP